MMILSNNSICHKISRLALMLVGTAVLMPLAQSCKTDDEPDWSLVDDNDNNGQDNISTNPATVFYESFNQLKGQGGNDGYFDNDSENNVEIAADDLEGTDELDNKTGWGDLVKVGVCDRCVRISTKKNSGSITTPALTLDGKTATLTFNAAAQIDDNVTLDVSVSNGGRLTYNGTTASTLHIALPATIKGKTVLANQNYAMTINGVSKSCQITFSTTSAANNKQRAFLDEIKIVVE